MKKRLSIPLRSKAIFMTNVNMLYLTFTKKKYFIFEMYISKY